MKFKVGDRVRCIHPPYMDIYPEPNNHGGVGWELGHEFTVSSITTTSQGYLVCWGTKSGQGVYQYALENISSNPTFMTGLIEKFKMLTMGEPEKSFRKTGITNGDDMLTDEGQKIFLSFLLQQNGPKFKEEVVDKLLAEQEKEKK